MNSWNQNQLNNVVGQAQFNPYQQRLPVYKADPIHGGKCRMAISYWQRRNLSTRCG